MIILENKLSEDGERLVRLDIEDIRRPFKTKIEKGRAVPTHIEPYRVINAAGKPSIYFVEANPTFRQGLYVYTDGWQVPEKELEGFGLPSTKTFSSPEDYPTKMEATPQALKTLRQKRHIENER